MQGNSQHLTVGGAWQLFQAVAEGWRLEAGGVCVSFVFHLGLLREWRENKVKFKQTIRPQENQVFGRDE